MHMYTPWWVWLQVYTIMLTTPVPVYILVRKDIQNTCLVQFSTHPTTCTYTRTQARLERQHGSDCTKSWCRCRKLLVSPLFKTIFSTSNTSTSLYPGWHWCHSRVHNSGEALCSFTLAPCIVVERLEGRQWCSRAPVGEHAGDPAWRCTMWLFANNKGSMQNNQNPQQRITLLWPHASQTMPAHLHWGRANPPGPWPAQAASHKEDPLKTDSHFSHCRAFFLTKRAATLCGQEGYILCASGTLLIDTKDLWLITLSADNEAGPPMILFSIFTNTHLSDMSCEKLAPVLIYTSRVSMKNHDARGD